MAMALNPAIFKWARESAGLSLEQAAQQLEFNDTRTRSAVQRLAAIESGEKEPSRSVLNRMARVYRRSLLVFYLQEPPRKGDRGKDFRTVPGASSPLFNPVLDALIRDLRGRQSIVRALVEDDELPVDFIGAATMDEPAVELARRIMARLQFSLEEFRRQATPKLSFKYLRQRIESVGVYVLLLGNLGNHHTKIPVDVFRGFAIADPVAPFIVVNDQDVTQARSFTALHEVVHLWLGETGVSGGDIEAQIEKYCNDVAGEILLPADEVRETLSQLRTAPLNRAIETIRNFAKARKISRRMVAYKLLRTDVISHTRWQELNKYFQQEWLKAQARQHQVKNSGGPDYYTVRRQRLGDALLDLMRRSLGEGAITHTKAGQVLGVKPGNVAPLLYDPPLQRATR
jgi:Zn-dependent peptidase ImmA (M78 family)